MFRKSLAVVRTVVVAVAMAALALFSVARGPANGLLKLTGCIALVMVALAFTRLPFDAHRWLGTAAGTCANASVHQIVVLGGSGMPSGPELLRLHHAAELARQYPSARVFVLHPPDSATVRMMVDELALRGVDLARTRVVLEGTNTREQALALARRSQLAGAGGITVVTAPENMYRSVRALRKAGLERACGAPAWDHPMFIGLGYGHRAIGGRTYVPDVSGSLDLRYNFWNNLKLEVTCLREWVAIAYYRANGWI